MSHSAFFYGTLLHPAILRRVIGHEGIQLQLCPAILLDHTRHKIKNADYPAVLPYSRSRDLFLQAGQKDLTPEERTVRGTYVSGLSDRDIALLDLFEGDEYTRERVNVHPLGPLVPLSSHPTSPAPARTAPEGATDAYIVPLTAPELPPLANLPPPISAETYIYAGPMSSLSPELWSYDDFVRENAWKWVGRGERDEYYVEVDRRREMDGKTLQTAIVNAGNGTDAADDGKVVVAEVKQ
ncbi:hypothetical protein PYCCODRAFT_1431487 [Trametes coccinea BRFM310]|uniref:Putative gamma-glutamylcyclotransferase n=1 Tax=Trametes coccinea (strain BRFM310) TaxID=1353009 RepID=A0A1Y2J2S1_TRAC3|nr:hypothetical protein PYCCODRAFT_1431487 [Trametes coccinea BRFM310]